jgi:hypothetical protein
MESDDMAKVIIYIPFDRATTPLLRDVEPLMGNALDMPASWNFTEKRVVFLNEENLPANQVAHGDTLLVNAHGGESDTDIEDVPNRTMTETDLFRKMDLLQASRAATVIFFCCYSAKSGLAESYKTLHSLQTVYGSKGKCSGGQLFTSTRRTIKTAAWADPDEHLVEMQ